MDAASMRALRVHRQGEEISARLEDVPRPQPAAGEVLIRAQYSSVNYKDALAVSGAGRILRRFPLAAGIDVAGRVESSNDARFAAGDSVLVTGCGLGESRDGGYADFVSVPGDAVVAVPDGLDARTAMVIGTAGFTAALAIERLQHNGLAAGQGPVVVTGASGGVGSMAIALLAAGGHEVVALSGKPEQGEYLRSLGAAEVLDRRQIDYGSRPMESARWAGAVDSVGGDMLAWLTRTMRPLGTIASIGLAGGHELHTTVMPFILRGIMLIGVNCDQVTREQRLALWQRLAGSMRAARLDRIAAREVALAEVPAECERLLETGAAGRTVVRIG